MPAGGSRTVKFTATPTTLTTITYEVTGGGKKVVLVQAYEKL